MSESRWLLVGVLFLLAVGIIIGARSCGTTTTTETTAAHHQTEIAEQHADSSTADFHHAKTLYDTTRHHVKLTDTNWVKVTLDRADTALAKGDRALADRDTVEARLHTELTIAQRPAPRLSVTVAALYDPIASTPAVSATIGLRVVREWSVIARADQRFAPGERPRAYVGVEHRF